MKRTVMAVLAAVVNVALYLALLSALIYAENPTIPAIPLLLLLTCTLIGSLLYFLYVPSAHRTAPTAVRESRNVVMPLSQRAEG